MPPMDIEPSLRDAPEVRLDPTERQTVHEVFDTSGDYLLIDPSGGMKIVSSADIHTTGDVARAFRALAVRLTAIHPAISTDESIFGGIPHIKGVRLSVGDILAKLYIYGNIQEILETYSPHVSEEQVKEAIAYAQDFLEMACDPDQTFEADD